MFVKDLYRDEIREGFIVKSDFKKVWNRYLEIWAEVDRICRGHGITYWAGDATLIGAVRHKGFIPWREEFSLQMFRPDYKRFCNVLVNKLNEPFAINQMNFAQIKIAHMQTTLIDFANFDADKPSGLTIEIVPLDVAPDGTSESFLAFNALNELYAASVNFAAIEAHLRGGGKTINDPVVLKKISVAGESEKFQTLQLYGEALFGQSSRAARIEDSINHVTPFDKDWFRETIYLPFETIELPVPVDCEKILTTRYGDWENFGRDEIKLAGDLYSAEIPCEEILRIIARHGGLEKTLRDGFLIQLYDNLP